MLNTSKKQYKTSKKKKTVRSIKARRARIKGKRGEKEAVELLKAYLNFEDEDVRIPIGCGETGSDIKRITKKAKKLFPFTAEIKNREEIKFWDAWKQAEKHSEKEGGLPLLLVKRNYQPFVACVPYEWFLIALDYINKEGK